MKQETVSHPAAFAHMFSYCKFKQLATCHMTNQFGSLEKKKGLNIANCYSDDEMWPDSIIQTRSARVDLVLVM